MPRRPAALAVVVALVLAVAGAGCGSDDGWAGTEGSSGGSTTTPPVGDCATDVVLVASASAGGDEMGDVVALTLDGEVRRLTDDGGSFGPATSPDGTEVAFASPGPDGEVSDSFGPYRTDIVAVGVDGSGRRTIVDGIDARAPDWSPDGQVLAYVEQGDPDADDVPDRIHVVDADGTGDRVLVAHDGPDDADPSWSPDGRRLAFVRGGYAGPQQVVVVDADGSGAQVVHEADAAVGAPVWSPDGGRLAFPLAPAGGTPTVLVLDLDTDEVVEVPGPVEGLSWAPSRHLHGLARPPVLVDFSGAWRVTELAPVGRGFGPGRAVSAIDPVGFLYADHGVDVPACVPQDRALTSERDDPEAIVHTDPATGDDIPLLPREQAEALALGQLSGEPAGYETEAALVYGDAATRSLLAATSPREVEIPADRFTWLVAYEDGLAAFDAATGDFLFAMGNTGGTLPPVTDLAA